MSLVIKMLVPRTWGCCLLKLQGCPWRNPGRAPFLSETTYVLGFAYQFLAQTKPEAGFHFQYLFSNSSLKVPHLSLEQQMQFSLNLSLQQFYLKLSKIRQILLCITCCKKPLGCGGSGIIKLSKFVNTAANSLTAKLFVTRAQIRKYFAVCLNMLLI